MKNWQCIFIIVHSVSFVITKYQMTSHDIDYDGLEGIIDLHGYNHNLSTISSESE
jgi:hypothetical protein